MMCPHCHNSLECKVTDSRERNGIIHRRRVCTKCGFRFKTVEVYDGASNEWVYGDMKPKVLGLNELEHWNQALWLEIKGGMLVATSIFDVTETTVRFCNKMVQVKALYGKQWRVWSTKPFEFDFAEYKWAQQ